MERVNPQPSKDNERLNFVLRQLAHAEDMLDMAPDTDMLTEDAEDLLTDIAATRVNLGIDDPVEEV